MFSLRPSYLYPESLWSGISTGTFWENWLRSNAQICWVSEANTNSLWNYKNVQGQGSRWIYLEIHVCDIVQKWVSSLLWLRWNLKLAPFNLQVPLLSSKVRYKGTFSFIKYVHLHSISCGYQGLSSFLRLTSTLEIWREAIPQQEHRIWLNWAFWRSAHVSLLSKCRQLLTNVLEGQVTSRGKGH